MLENFDWFTWVFLPLLVFGARVLDVTLGTMCIIFFSRGRKYLAPYLVCRSSDLDHKAGERGMIVYGI